MTEQKKCWDRESSLNRMNGNEMLLERIIKVFRDELPNSVAQLRTAVEANDFECVRKLVHTLTGQVGNFSADASLSALNVLQEYAREHNRLELDSAFADLEWELIALDSDLINESRTHEATRC